MMAQHYYRRRRELVVIRSEYAAAKSTYSQGGKIISVNILGAQRARRRFHSFTPHAQASHAGLERSYLFKFRSLNLKPLRQRIREHSPAVLWAAFNAAIIAFTHAIEGAWIGNRQGTEHNRMDQGENCRGPADSQGQRKNGCYGKDGR